MITFGLVVFQKNLFLLIFLIVCATPTSVTSTEDIPSDAIPAVIGINNGVIDSIYSVFFLLDEIGNFRFRLFGPEDTNFDLVLYDTSMNLIADSFLNSYPEQVVVSSANGFYIMISTRDGTGEFTLTIEEEPSLVYMSYYTGFQVGDELSWEIEYTATEPYYSYVSVIVNEVSPINVIGETNNLFTIKTEFTAYDIDNPDIYIVPSILHYDDDTSRNSTEYISMYWKMPADLFTSQDNMYEYYGMVNVLGMEVFLNFQYDIQTGILIFLEYMESGFELHYKVRLLSQVSDFVNRSVEEDLISVSEDTAEIKIHSLLALITIPILRYHRRYKTI